MYRRLERQLVRLEQLFGVNAMTNRDMLEAPGLEPLIDMLEPVKGYTRILGEELSTARKEGRDVTQITRPYDTVTLLNRVVDRIAPESAASRHFGTALEEGEDTTRWTAGWRDQYRTLLGVLPKRPELGELKAASRALAKVADTAGACLVDETASSRSASSSACASFSLRMCSCTSPCGISRNQHFAFLCP